MAVELKRCTFDPMLVSQNVFESLWNFQKLQSWQHCIINDFSFSFSDSRPVSLLTLSSLCSTSLLSIITKTSLMVLVSWDSTNQEPNKKVIKMQYQNQNNHFQWLIQCWTSYKCAKTLINMTSASIGEADVGDHPQRHHWKYDHRSVVSRRDTASIGNWYLM